MSRPIADKDMDAVVDLIIDIVDGKIDAHGKGLTAAGAAERVALARILLREKLRELLQR
jgi:ABC-type transport system involved in cytochrome bd biosynthesis fused ATPase/permease subunit